MNVVDTSDPFFELTPTAMNFKELRTWSRLGGGEMSEIVCSAADAALCKMRSFRLQLPIKVCAHIANAAQSPTGRH